MTSPTTPKTRSYRPANGFEEALFDENWCSKCARDAAWRADVSAEPCGILNRTMLHDINDPEYPVEWIEDAVPYDQPSNPRCTAFVAEGEDDPELEAARADPRQQALPL
jgi:hypothetical protein